MKLGRKEVGYPYPTYFIADIGSNHDGSLEKAVALIGLAAEAGADAVKFQNFIARTIVSDYGFKALGKLSHQSDWKESVFETYKRYETPLSWAPVLKRAADEAGIDYLTTPYSPHILNYLAPYVCAWKIGSGDITYDALIKAISQYDQPVLLATGASKREDVERALEWLGDKQVVLMQCNTNYTADKDNFKHVNLKVFNLWKLWSVQRGRTYPSVLGLSDHTPGHSAVLGAIALGARVIEKHFTASNDLEGPDHKFAMTPLTWRWMVDAARELEAALGGNVKTVAPNEAEAVVIQRRAIRAKRAIPVGKVLEEGDFVMLRPCPSDALPPYRLSEIVGIKCQKPIEAGDYVRAEHLSLM